LPQIEVADALIVRVVLAVPVLQAQRLVVGESVLEADHEVRLIERLPHLVAEADAGGIDRADDRRVEAAAAVAAQAKRRLAGQRAAQAEPGATVLLRG